MTKAHVIDINVKAGNDSGVFRQTLDLARKSGAGGKVKMFVLEEKSNIFLVVPEGGPGFRELLSGVRRIDGVIGTETAEIDVLVDDDTNLEGDSYLIVFNPEIGRERDVADKIRSLEGEGLKLRTLAIAYGARVDVLALFTCKSRPAVFMHEIRDGVEGLVDTEWYTLGQMTAV